MAKQAINVTKNKKGRGRPKKEPTSVIRLPSALLENIDRWAASLDDKPSRPEALRRIATEFVKRRGLL